MKRGLFYGAPIFTLFLLFAIDGYAYHRQQQSVGFSDLTLEAFTTKQKFIQLEPIPITLELSNKTAEPVVTQTSLNFDGNLVQLFVENSLNEQQEIGLSSVRVLMSIDPITIQPGGKYRGRQQLLVLALDRAFPQPGHYYLQFVLKDRMSEEVVKSDRLEIEIKRPEGLDLEAFNFIKSKGKQSNFFNSVTVSTPNTVEEFVARYGESVYGDYATFMLGQFYFIKQEFEKAKGQLEKVSTKAKFFFADEASNYLDKIKKKQQH